jgi:hypothetical protein
MTGSLIVKLGSSGGGGSTAWGAITGTLSNQTDLQAALDLRATLNSPDFQVRANILGSGIASGQLHLYDADSTHSVALNTSASLAANFAITLPAETGTMALRGANTFTALQTITQDTANTGVFASTGYSLTGSNATNAFDIAGTLNTSGNPSVLRVAMTTTAAGSTTALARFLGTTTGAANIFAVLAPVADAQASAAIQIGTGLFCGEYTASSSFWFGQSNNKFASRFAIDTIGAVVASNGYYAFGGDIFANSSTDLMIRRRAAAWLGLGTAAASPVEQTFSGCDGSGTNITGGILNISAGRGTGTGISGVLNFRSHAAAASGSTVNATPVNVLSIIRPGVIRITNIPTSSGGLSTGDVYSNAGVLTIV